MESYGARTDSESRSRLPLFRSRLLSAVSGNLYAAAAHVRFGSNGKGEAHKPKRSFPSYRSGAAGGITRTQAAFRG